MWLKKLQHVHTDVFKLCKAVKCNRCYRFSLSRGYSYRHHFRLSRYKVTHVYDMYNNVVKKYDLLTLFHVNKQFQGPQEGKMIT